MSVLKQSIWIEISGINYDGRGAIWGKIDFPKHSSNLIMLLGPYLALGINCPLLILGKCPYQRRHE